ncbi:MAG: hypothetical protein CMB80_12220 [Flammeovirgaceae bacterium]|jgi:hypothetical protein|nr:hypothetical protein [Flammeovirgaceae bacterium]
MIEWFEANWIAIGGSIVSVVALGWLPFTRVLIRKGIGVVMSETFLKELFFDLAEKYVKSTKTKLDDTFLKQLKNSF